MQAIADGLTDGIQTAQGGTWQPSTVRKAAMSQRAVELILDSE